MLHHPSTMPAPKPLTISEFFGEICPEAMRQRSDVCRAVGGVFGFRLLGAGGGEWSIDLAKSEVAKNVLRGADLVLEMRATDFVKMLKGLLDLDRATREERIVCYGEPSRLLDLALILRPTAPKAR